MQNCKKNLLKVENLRVSYNLGASLFSSGKNKFNAVDDVSFSLDKGEILGIVGESGSGKTTTGRAIIHLAPIAQGQIFFDGELISNKSLREFMPYRKKIQMIFQDPFNSLNPRMSVYDIIAEPLDIHFKKMSKDQKFARVEALLEKVGLAKEHILRYPHEFSGGQRQRIGIARALAVEPELIICDEPVSALDVSVQAQIVNLLQELRQEMNLSLIFIAHDIAVVEYLCDNMLVMNKGKVVEAGDVETLCSAPKNSYTKKLIASVPKF